jgi:hypothetical protein
MKIIALILVGTARTFVVAIEAQTVGIGSSVALPASLALRVRRQINNRTITTAP